MRVIRYTSDLGAHSFEATSYKRGTQACYTGANLERSGIQNARTTEALANISRRGAHLTTAGVPAWSFHSTNCTTHTHTYTHTHSAETPLPFFLRPAHQTYITAPWHFFFPPLIHLSLPPFLSLSLSPAPNDSKKQAPVHLPIQPPACMAQAPFHPLGSLVQVVGSMGCTQPLLSAIANPPPSLSVCGMGNGDKLKMGREDEVDSRPTHSPTPISLTGVT